MSTARQVGGRRKAGSGYKKEVNPAYMRGV